MGIVIYAVLCAYGLYLENDKSYPLGRWLIAAGQVWLLGMVYVMAQAGMGRM